MSMQKYFQPQPNKFIGEIVNVTLEDAPSDWGAGRKRILVELRPVDPDAYTNKVLYFTASTQPRSNWQRWLAELRRIASPKPIVDERDMLGMFVELHEVVTESFRDPSRTVSFWKPVRIFSSEAEAKQAWEQTLAEIEPAAVEDEPPFEFNPQVEATLRDAWNACSGNPAVFRAAAKMIMPNLADEEIERYMAKFSK